MIATHLYKTDAKTLEDFIRVIYDAFKDERHKPKVIEPVRLIHDFVSWLKGYADSAMKGIKGFKCLTLKPMQYGTRNRAVYVCGKPLFMTSSKITYFPHPPNQKSITGRDSSSTSSSQNDGALQLDERLSKLHLPPDTHKAVAELVHDEVQRRRVRIQVGQVTRRCLHVVLFRESRFPRVLFWQLVCRLCKT